MRKYIAICAVFTFLLFALGLMAQTTGAYGQMDSSQNSNTSPSSQSSGSWQGSAPPASSNSQSPSSSGSVNTSDQQNPSYGSSGMGSQTSSSSGMGQQASMEGCMVREQTDYFLIPQTGNPVRLSANSTSDLSSHLGQHVRIFGHEAPASGNVAESANPRETPLEAQNPSASGSSGTAGMTGSATGGTSATSSNEPSSPGAVGSNAGAPSSASESGSTSSNPASMSAAATEQFTVDRITTMAESCPANWNSQWNSATSGSQSKK